MEVSFRKHARPSGAPLFFVIFVNVNAHAYADLLSASPQMTESKKQRVETFVYASPTQVLAVKKIDLCPNARKNLTYAVTPFAW